MTKERAISIIGEIISFGIKGNKNFVKDLINSAHLTNIEIEELGIDNYIKEENVVFKVYVYKEGFGKDNTNRPIITNTFEFDSKETATKFVLKELRNRISEINQYDYVSFSYEIWENKKFLEEFLITIQKNSYECHFRKANSTTYEEIEI